MPKLVRLRRFVQAFTRLMESGPEEPRIFAEGGALLEELVAHDDWLPEEFARPDPARYQQYLLYCDPFERFSVVSFVWNPGQATPVHDHTVWGMIGVLRGAELCEECDLAGQPLARHELQPGQVDLVSPRIGDIHAVANARPDGPSVSIHVYGANIGRLRRHVFENGASREFVSGYANRLLPNLWV